MSYVYFTPNGHPARRLCAKVRRGETPAAAAARALARPGNYRVTALAALPAPPADAWCVTLERNRYNRGVSVEVISFVLCAAPHNPAHAAPYAKRTPGRARRAARLFVRGTEEELP